MSESQTEISTSGRLYADFIRLVYLHATKETKKFQRSRFLAALKTRLGLILAVAIRVMINATGCPAPALDRNRMNNNDIAPRISLSSVPFGLPL